MFAHGLIRKIILYRKNKAYSFPIGADNVKVFDAEAMIWNELILWQKGQI
jgi:hypothetical protein